MKLGELWKKKVVSFPDSLMYYDKDKNEQDTITVTYEMDDFCNNNADKKVLNYEIDFTRSILWVEITKSDREKFEEWVKREKEEWVKREKEAGE